MLRLLGKHFLAVVLLWPLGMMVLFAATAFAGFAFYKRGLLGVSDIDNVYLGSPFIPAFALGLLLTLARRRSGMSGRFLLWFPGLVAVQMLVYLVLSVWFAKSVVERVSLNSVIAHVWHFTPEFLLFAAAYGVTALLGGAVGLFAARLMFRSGRWETIVPFQAPGKS